MVGVCEASEVLALLEGGAGGARDAAEQLGALYGGVREPWLVRGLLQYHARTGSQRAIDLLARAQDPHSKFLLDALQEQLRSTERGARQQALAALAPLIARRPAWLHRLPQHPIVKDLVRAARVERAVLPLLHALLALAALLPSAPALASPHWPDLADALLRPAALDPPPQPAARAHLQLAQLALFHALYATHPCTLIDTLRAELTAPANRDAWERGLAPLIHSVRLHPALLTGSRAKEADVARWARLEPHDVLAESRRLSLRTPERPASPIASPAPAPAPPLPSSPAPGSGAHVSKALNTLRPGSEQWFALADKCGTDSAPHTPLPADVDSAEPPEAAVEATPENTPARETRAQFRFPTDSGAVRAISGRTSRKETSPPAVGEAYAARISRVLAERRAADSPVPIAGAPPPAGVARPQPSRALALDCELNVEDREVLELTARARGPLAWSDAEGAPPARPRDPRSLRRGCRRRAAGPARRPASCSPARGLPRQSVAVQTVDAWPEPYEFLIADFYRDHPDDPMKQVSCSPARGLPRQSVAVQTVDAWPEPYEFLIADFYRDHPDDPMKQGTETEHDPTSPCERLDAYLADLYKGGGSAKHSELTEQVGLLHAQLMYERWRREAHAERNRRLLGKCRQTRALELQNGALKDRVRALTRERDELRVRLARDASATPAVPSAAEIEASLEAALNEEREARAKAEAALHEAEAQRALDAAELQRIRGESFESARHVEALARAALAAERRGEHVRRLRRELLILAEREARLSAAVKQACEVPTSATEKVTGEERALKAAYAKAEAEAAANATKAEAATLKAHELEATLTARDAALAELKRMMRHAAEEHEAKIKAMQDKYSALMKVVRATEARNLERLALDCMPPESTRGHNTPPSVGSASSAGAAGLTLGPADCHRTRKLLQLDDDIDAPETQMED